MKTYMIPTDHLFEEINNSRELVQKAAIENNLLASKLAILIAIKTEKYANFKTEFVELTEAQLNALEKITFDYFNANISKRLPLLIINDNYLKNEPLIQRAQRSFIQKISSFFGFGSQSTT